MTQANTEPEPYSAHGFTPLPQEPPGFEMDFFQLNPDTHRGRIGTFHISFRDPWCGMARLKRVPYDVFWEAIIVLVHIDEARGIQLLDQLDYDVKINPFLNSEIARFAALHSASDLAELEDWWALAHQLDKEEMRQRPLWRKLLGIPPEPPK